MHKTAIGHIGRIKVIESTNNDITKKPINFPDMFKEGNNIKVEYDTISKDLIFSQI